MNQSQERKQQTRTTFHLNHYSSFKCIPLIVLVLLILFIYSCDKNPTNNHISFEPGFALTFDDAYVRDWFEFRETLASYDVRATFFVTRFAELSDSEKVMLRELELSGHEVGSHGANHINAVSFLETDSEEEYVDQEVVASFDMMRKSDLNPVSFAYPFGENTPELDQLVLQYATIVRDVTEVQRTTRTIPVNQIDEVFYRENSPHVVAALGIDTVFNVTLEEMNDAFARAASQNEIIVLYSHRPTETVTLPYDSDIAFLCSLFEMAKEYGLRSYTMKELSSW